MAEEEDEAPIELDIRPETVVFIIVKARAFDAKEAPVEEDPGSNPADDGQREILEDFPEDDTAEELKEAIDGLNEDAAIDLIAMTWIGRGDFTPSEWPEARALAAERHVRSPSSYLMGIPDLGDLIEEGFTALGYSPEEYEIGRL
jgi:Protein of unknown function (DUF3775)